MDSIVIAGAVLATRPSRLRRLAQGRSAPLESSGKRAD
jgi:hypothetical protein